MPSRAAETRLALISLVAALDNRHGRCAEIIDIATETAAQAPLEVVEAVGGETMTAARLGAVKAFAAICSACGACPRGQDLDAAAFIARPLPEPAHGTTAA